MRRVGIIGAGQLGRMLGAAGLKLDVACRFLDPAPSPPAASVGPVIAHRFDDIAALAELASGTDVLTYEFENVPVAALESLAPTISVRPPLIALREAQDRAREKALFERLDIPLPRWHTVDGREDLERAAAHVGLPLVLKTRRFGYDGKGQVVVEDAGQFDAAVAELPAQPLIAEQWIRFDREVSGIGTRAANGATAFYPLTENEHRDGILRVSRAPAGPAGLAALARDYTGRLLEHLDYVGTLALELFVVGDLLLANEFAPRVHNSGHWTIEGAATSQFENHLRAVLDLPLGDSRALAHAGMLNVIGKSPADPAAIAASGAYLHDYDKAPRPGRKLGHVTVLADDAAARDRKLAEIAALLGH